MIFGTVDVEDDAVVTHRDSYLLAQLSVVSVRRPFLAPGLLTAAGFGGFALNFGDLLYLEEIATATGLAAFSLFLGIGVGQLKLLSRDLRGSELSDAVWGSYGHLNRVRTEIVARLKTMRLEDRA